MAAIVVAVIRSIKMKVRSLHFDCSPCELGCSGCWRKLRDLGIACAAMSIFGDDRALRVAATNHWEGME